MINLVNTLAFSENIVYAYTKLSIWTIIFGTTNIFTTSNTYILAEYSDKFWFNNETGFWCWKKENCGNCGCLGKRIGNTRGTNDKNLTIDIDSKKSLKDFYEEDTTEFRRIYKNKRKSEFSW